MYKLAIALILVLTVSFVAASTNPLTTENFADSTKEGKFLVKFFAPWCGHCKNLAPIYAEASAKIDATVPGFQLVSVDCTVEKTLCQEHGIRGYPTLKYFENGAFVEDYKSGRTVQAIVDFATSKTAQ